MLEKNHIEKFAESTAKTDELLIEELKDINKKLSGDEQGDLSNLKTLAKNNIVSALNEVKDQLDTTAKKGNVSLERESYSKDGIEDFDEDPTYQMAITDSGVAFRRISHAEENQGSSKAVLGSWRKILTDNDLSLRAIYAISCASQIPPIEILFSKRIKINHSISPNFQADITEPGYYKILSNKTNGVYFFSRGSMDDIGGTKDLTFASIGYPEKEGIFNYHTERKEHSFKVSFLEIKYPIISIGDNHSLACSFKGEVVYSWGDNGNGQLGRETSRYSDGESKKPGRTQFPEGVKIDQVVAGKSGNHYSFVIDNNGKLYRCGGSINRGLFKEVKFSEEVRIIQVEAISDCTFALGSNGKLYSWGKNEKGRLGRKIEGELSNETQEVKFPEEVKIIRVLSGTSHALALSSDGKLYSWGSNENGQLARKIQSDFSNEPGEVGFAKGVKIIQMATGDNHSFALSSDGKLYSCGKNEKGQLGRKIEGKFSNEFGEIGFSQEIKILQVIVGKSHVLALSSNEKVYSWGNNEDGQLGRKIEGKFSNDPAQVEFNKILKISQVATEGDCTFALDNNGKLYSWGKDSYGANSIRQLGRETNYGSSWSQTPSNKPGEVKFPEGVKIIQVITRGDCTFALGSNGKLYSWGKNEKGQLGNWQANDQYNSSHDLPMEVQLPRDFFSRESIVDHS